MVACPRFPLARRALREFRGERVVRRGRHAERFGEVPEEARLERRERDPALRRRVQIIASEAAAQQAIGRGQPFAKRLRDVARDIGQRDRAARST